MKSILTMTMTNRNSYFDHFHYSSKLAKELFKENSDYIVLQIMDVGDGYFLAEILKRSPISQEKHVL